MKNFYGLLCLPLFLWACSDKTPSKSEQEIAWEKAVAEAQSTSGNGAPALWKMGDDDTDIFLFGTVHFIPPSVEWKNETIMEAFDQAHTIYFEINVEDEQTHYDYEDFVDDNGYLPKGESLYDKMTPKEEGQLRKHLRSIDYEEEAIEALMPWMASSDIAEYMMMQAGYSPFVGVEMILWKEARKQNKSFGNMETVQEQMGAVAGASFEDQLESLLSLATENYDIEEDMTIMMEEWLDGDVYGLGLLTASPELETSRDHYERMLLQRNQNWIPRIEALLDQPGTHFIAVGAAHLAGPDSVVLMLEKNGHELIQVQ